MSDSESLAPHLKVVSGNPTPEELAVVVALLQAARNSAVAEGASVREPVSTWARNAGQLRGSLTPGHNQWQTSFRRGLN